jgi:hypothetical protein
LLAHRFADANNARSSLNDSASASSICGVVIASAFNQTNASYAEGVSGSLVLDFDDTLPAGLMFSRRPIVEIVLTCAVQIASQGDGLSSMTWFAFQFVVGDFLGRTARTYKLIVGMSAGMKWFGGEPITTLTNSLRSSAVRSLGGLINSRVEPLTRTAWTRQIVEACGRAIAGVAVR